MNMLEKVTKDFIRYWCFPTLRPRRFHAYGLGNVKTGTNSLAGVFGRYRTLHEPDRPQYMQVIVARGDGTLSDAAARDRVRTLDRRLWLELSSSYLNYFLMDLRLDLYPEAKFFLTIRDCYSWIDSAINEHLGREASPYQHVFRRWWAETHSPGKHRKEDQALAEHGLWPIEDWVRAWNQHNQRVLDTIPADRLMVMRTQDIRGEFARMADFIGVEEGTLESHRSHEYKAAAKLGMLDKVDKGYLEDCVARHAGDLMSRYFPEVTGLADIKGYRPADREANRKNGRKSGREAAAGG